MRTACSPFKLCGFRPQRSIADVLFIVCRLQGLGQGRSCFVDLQNACNSVHRLFLWTVLARYGVPPEMVIVIRHFRGYMRARVGTEDGDCSG